MVAHPTLIEISEVSAARSMVSGIAHIEEPFIIIYIALFGGNTRRDEDMIQTLPLLLESVCTHHFRRMIQSHRRCRWL